MDKMAVVITFDAPNDGAVGEIIEDVLGVVKPLFIEQKNVHVWAGIKESAQEILNVIGVD